MIITVQPQFDLGLTSIRLQKPWTSPFYGSMNGPSLKTLLPTITRLNCWPPLTIAGSNCPKHFGHYFYPNMKLFHFIYLFFYFFFYYYFFLCVYRFRYSGLFSNLKNQVTQLNPSIIPFGFNLCKIYQLTHVLHHNAILY